MRSGAEGMLLPTDARAMEVLLMVCSTWERGTDASSKQLERGSSCLRYRNTKTLSEDDDGSVSLLSLLENECREQ